MFFRKSLLAALWGAGTWAALPGAEPPRISPECLKAAIQAHAPILVCDREETYLPTSVESYLDITEPVEGPDWQCVKTCQGLRFRTPLPAAADALEALRAGAPALAKAYVNVKVGRTTTDLQYWFLYAYNGPATAYLKSLDWDLRYGVLGAYPLTGVGVHEGDWEHVTIPIDNGTGAIAGQVFMAVHDHGQTWDPVSCTASVDGAPRIQVYASRNGHASYPGPARWYPVTVKAGLLEFRLLDDTSAPGLAVDFRGRCELLGIQGDPGLKAAMVPGGFQEPAFEAAYPGRWGRSIEKPGPYEDVPVLGSLTAGLLEAAGVYDEFTCEAGPYPPWSKTSWTGAE